MLDDLGHNVSPGPTSTTAPTVTSTAGPESRTERWWLIPVTVVVTMVGLVGTIWVLSDRGQHYEYSVEVSLTRDATAGQKAAIKRGLAELHPVDGIQFTSRDTLAKGYNALLGGKVQANDLAAIPETYKLTTRGSSFNCAKASPTMKLPGVAKFEVTQYSRRGASTTTPIRCD